MHFSELYYGSTKNGELCFASEAKALLPITSDISELEPAAYFDGKNIKDHGSIEVKKPLAWPVEEIAMELRDTLVDAVKNSIDAKNSTGVWLSDVLNSSIISAIASRYVDDLLTYSIGFKDTEFLQSTRKAALD